MVVVAREISWERTRASWTRTASTLTSWATAGPDAGLATLKELTEDDFMAGVAVALEAGNPAGDATDLGIDESSLIIRELTWKLNLDVCAELKLGWAESTKKSPDERFRELVARERQESGSP